jgi:superoxide dismutase
MMKLEDVIPALNMGTPKVIRNNAGGIYNHLIFFKVNSLRSILCLPA